MAKFRSKPVEIEATQLTFEAIVAALYEGGSLPNGVTFRGEVTLTPERSHMGTFVCQSRNGEVTASPDDWIIQELDAPGLAYPCKPDVFAMKYEPVDGESTAA